MVLDTAAATVADNYKARAMRSATVVRGERDVDDTLVVQAIPSGWTVVAYERQFRDCWDVRRFEDMFSDGQTSSMYDRKRLKRDTDIGGGNLQDMECHTICAT